MTYYFSLYLLLCTHPDRAAATKETEGLKGYNIYGVTIAEVEIDLLTGQHIIRRVDLMEDCGISLNPEVDLGQIEGAFVMGIGYWTSEELVFDSKTGILTNDRTWVGDIYRVLVILVIIIFFKVVLILKRIIRLNYILFLFFIEL